MKNPVAVIPLVIAAIALAQTNPVPSAVIGIFSPDKPAGTIGNETHKNLGIAPGTTSTILSAVTGSGYINEIFIATSQYNTEVIITVDGEPTPSIDGNLADFFGDSYMDTQAAFMGRWIQGSNAGRGNVGGTFKLPVPFANSVQIQLRNNSASTALITSHIIYHLGVPDNWPYTQRLRMSVVNSPKVAPYAEVDMVNVAPNKRGKLAGFGWIYDSGPGSVSPPAAPLEGAFKIYLDGASNPNYATSGSEDIFGMPWYFRNLDSLGAGLNKTLTPPGGEVAYTVYKQNSEGQMWGAQRFFVADPITFNTGLRFTWTCGNKAAVTFTGTCTLRSTVWYYTEN